MGNFLVAAGAVVLIFIGGLFLKGDSKIGFVNPLSQKEDSVLKQKIIDKKIFDENKGMIKGGEVSWADGQAGSHDTVVSSGYIVVGKDGKPVFALNPDKRLSPASLTKLVTVMVALDLAQEGDLFEVTKNSVGMEPTIIMVDEGERFSLDELLRASLMTSANDAADVLARGVAKKLGGSVEVFMMFMNEKVRLLGLENTNFKNSTGYDEDGQYTSARDLAKITYFALENYPKIKEIVGTREATIEESSLHKYYELPNWNGLLGVYPGVDGVKIGYTEGAGYVTIVSSEQRGERFLVVLLGAPDRWARDNWAHQLLNSAFLQVGIRPFRVTRQMIKIERETKWNEQLKRAKEKTRPWRGGIMNKQSLFFAEAKNNE